ncbi:hypothetical protein B0A48_16900 [Cryoendolithus antarcticus]|uniref:AMP-activated protein kinase glycogen-binding domain-containing protein n=1 Tax=Cryoendolithus antarcticus TaxID=1507870 RepID=A0A1V8SD71_9PEZI|nr:hypothetical protein B0A48_16900 [Cryoendolithus antarcticus]
MAILTSHDREHPANEVYVTGTFDNWSKSTLLEKSGSAHEKTIELPETGDKILYKFVADGNWSYDHTAKSEADESGNLNNVLYPSDLKHSSTSKSHSGPIAAGAAAISSVAPGASSTKMAGKQPLTRERSMPGEFPQTPGTELPGAFPETSAAGAAQQLSVNPLPAAPGAVNPTQTVPGEKVPDASILHGNTLTSNVHDDEELKKQDQGSERAFGVAPLPATGGASNPISLAPGEKVPDASTITGNTLTSNVKLDKEAYEKSDSGAPMLPAFTPGLEKEAAGGSIFGMPSAGGAGSTMIPESGLPMGDKAVSDLGNMGPTTSSVAPQSSTNALAGHQPIEPRGVPSVVSESQEKANAESEAAANPEAVQEKSALEQELKQKVPEEPATASSGTFGSSGRGVTGAVAGGLAAAGAAAAGGAYALRDKTTAATGTDPASVLPKSVQDQLPKSNGSQTTEGTSAVPAVVSESQEKAHAEPEAAANPEAVQEKSALEQELKAKVPEEPATTESGAFGKSEKDITGAIAGGATAATAAVAGGAYALRDKATGATGSDPASGLNGSQATESTTRVPAVVSESQEKAHVEPEAAANPEAVQEKSALEQELKQKVPEEPATTSSGAFGSSEKGVTAALAGGATAATAAVAGGAYALRDKATGATGSDPASGLNGSQATESTTRVPAVVSESQEKAHVEPEAAANPEAVQEKSALEQELKQKVPEEPATTSSGAFGFSEGGVTGALAGGAAAATAAVAGGAYALRDKTAQTTGKDPVSALPQSIQDSINNMNSKGTTAPARPATNEPTPSYISKDPTLPQQTTLGGPITIPAEEDATRKTTDSVPETVLESQQKAHVDPEAAANPTAVAEKQDFEKELLGRVPTAEATGESAPTAASSSDAPLAGATSGTAPIASSSGKAPLIGAAAGAGILGAGAGALAGSRSTGAPRLEDPTKDVSPITMNEPTSTATGSGLNASADSPAVPSTQTDTSRLAAPATPTKLADSRDVSPMSKVATASHPTGESGPSVTDGVASSSTPAVSKPVGSRPGVANSTPGKRGSFIDRMKGTPDSSKSGKTTESGTKKKSFFGKLKEKLKQ